MKHVMLDIETMGTGMNAAIVSIGAFKFGKDTFVDDCQDQTNGFYAVPMHWKGDITQSTVEWWLSQPKEAANAFMMAEKLPLVDCLTELSKFVGDCCVWGNGADFDNVIVQAACVREGLKSWPYRNNRCFRTIKNIYEYTAYTKPVIPHHPLHDAIAQATTLVRLAKSYGIPL